MSDGGLDSFTDDDGIPIAYRRWLPTGDARAVVVVAHGASEHSARYDRFARALVDRGYAVFAIDHRGHGETATATGPTWNIFFGFWEPKSDQRLEISNPQAASRAWRMSRSPFR